MIGIQKILILPLIFFLVFSLPFLGADVGFKLSGFHRVYFFLLVICFIFSLTQIKKIPFLFISFVLLLTFTIFNIFWHTLLLNNESIRLLLLLFNGFLLYIVIYSFVIQNPRNVFYLLDIILLVFAIHGVLAIIQFLKPELISDPIRVYLGNKIVVRAEGVIGHPGPFGVFMAMIWPISFSLLFSSKNWGSFILFSIIFILGSSGILLSLTRSAWIGDVVALTVFITTAFIYKKVSINKKFLYLVVIILLFLLLISSSLILKRFFASDIFWQLNLRWKLNTLAWKLFLSHPFLGVGVGNSLNVMKCLYLGIHHRIHNQYFFWLVEYGIIGFLFWLLFIISCLFMVTKALKISTTKKHFRMIAGVNAMFWGLLVTNNSGLPMSHVSIFMLFCFFIGLISGINFQLKYENL